MKHNKKRNTAFIYETLSRELTKAIVDKDNNRKATVLAIIPVIISKITDGNFVFLASKSNKYEKMINRGRSIKIDPVFIGKY